MPVRSCTFLLNTHWYYAIFKYPRCYNIIYRTCIYSMISCYHAQKTVNIFWVLHCTKMFFLGRGDSLCTGCVEVGLTKTPAPLPPPTHTLRDHSKNITGGVEVFEGGTQISSFLGGGGQILPIFWGGSTHFCQILIIKKQTEIAQIFNMAIEHIYVLK